jgi:hypothetical protein
MAGSPPHRGRVQAQGCGTEESVAWADDAPPTESEVLAMLDELEQKLSPAEQQERASAFREAREFVRRSARAGGITAPVSKSFPRKPLKGGIRVDFEVIAGQACVPD